MISSANCNMYEASAQSALAVYEAFLRGRCTALAVSVCSHELNDTARGAVDKSMAALGYGSGACAHIAIEAQGVSIGASDVHNMIEAIDPLALILCDDSAVQIVSHAYRRPIEADADGRVLGRSVAAFRDLESMMGTPEGKQRAWALFKKLPHLE